MRVPVPVSVRVHVTKLFTYKFKGKHSLIFMLFINTAKIENDARAKVKHKQSCTLAQIYKRNY